jgi:hypothetical protein
MMIKTSVLRYAAIGMATISMAGFAAASTVGFDTTGPDSNNEVELSSHSRVSSDNTNVVGVSSFNAQGAETGDVHASKNTSVGGSNGSGDATNANSTGTNVSVSNTGSNAAVAALAGMGSANHTVTFDTTGPESNNEVTIDDSRRVEVSNTNRVEVNNVNLQGAKSGDVSAYKNTTVGGLTSGDAHNTNTTTTSVSVSN